MENLRSITLQFKSLYDWIIDKYLLYLTFCVTFSCPKPFVMQNEGQIL